MSHRPEDIYPYVATTDIMTGSVCAFKEGDPVPAETAETLDLISDGTVVRRDQYKPAAAEPARAMERGEMPPHLRDKVAAGDEKPKAPARKPTKGMASE